MERRGSLTSISTTATTDSSSSGGQKAPQDFTLVTEDYQSQAPGELTVRRGQHVEIVDCAPGQADYCLIRSLPPDGADQAQGLVPISILKPMSYLKTPGARNSIDLDDPMTNAEGTASPVSKRRSSFKKWFTTPVRKLSHGKIEKQGGILLDPQRALQRGQGSLSEAGPGETTPTNEQPVTPQVSMMAQKTPLDATNEEEEPAQDIEMPPPMEIQDHTFKAETKEPPTDDVTAKLASQLSLKPQSETMELTSQLKNIVKQRMEPVADSDSTTPGGCEANSVDATLNVESRDDDEDDDDDDNGGDETKDKQSEKAKYLNKRRFVVQELFDTEKDYVKDLASIVEGYMTYMRDNPVPEDMQGKDKIVFGNVHQIYDWHKETMLIELEKCLTTPEKVGSIFLRYERRLYMYVKYCENKPKSEFIVSEYLDTYFEEVRQKLGHRLMLPDMLIKPVQRIMRYQLLLKDILKYTEKAEEDTTELRKALRVMCVVPKAANDMMQVGRLQGFDGKITAQGKLLLQDTLLVSEVSAAAAQKYKERRVFLFEQIIIFSEMMERKKGNFSNASYTYKNSLKVNKMSLSDKVEGEPLRFTLTDRTPGSDFKLIIQANSSENKDTWISQIRSILDMQGDFLRALQSPIAYQKELTKELSAPEFSPTTPESTLRKTQSHPLSKVHNLSPLKSSKTRSDSAPLTVKKTDRSLASSQDDAAESGRPVVGKNSCPSSPTDPRELNLTSPGSDSSLRKTSMGSGLVENAGSNSPKPRKTIFDGFRNTLGRKSKSSDSKPDSWSNSTQSRNNGSMDLSAGSAAPSPDLKTSEQVVADENQPEAGSALSTSNVSSDLPMTSGRILFDYTAIREDEVTVSKGEVVQVLNTNQLNMFFIHRPPTQSSPAAEGWIPCHILGPKDGDSGSLRKGSRQMFKLKKPMFRHASKSEMDTTKSKRSNEVTGSEGRSRSLTRDGKNKKETQISGSGIEMPPFIQQPLTSVTALAGDTVTLTCIICGRPRPSVNWTYQDSQVIGHSSRVMMLYNEEGHATLQISNASSVDNGEYTCVAKSEIGSAVTRTTLTVLDRPAAPAKPIIKNQVGTAVHLEWAPPSNAQTTPTLQMGTPAQIQGYTIEFKEAGSSVWQLAIPYVPNTSQVIGDLEPGVTYQFRVSANNAIGISEPSVSSSYVVIPSECELSDREDGAGVMWKTTFENDFTDLGEIGKGRFSVVHRCIQKCSGQELAVKFITKQLTKKEAVETEYNTLQSLQHLHLVKVFDLYESSSSNIIIMQLFEQGRLLEHICGRQHFDELVAGDFLSQILECLKYLHNCRIAHLDIKPENLMVEVTPTASVVKLVDFGDARHIYNNYYIHPMVGHPEFMSPEIVSGTPVGLCTDIWSAGVLLYVLLSGVSPFLDESQEETCSNIVTNDFCFPDQYFAGISQDAKELVRFMLIEDLSQRPTAQACLDSNWLRKAATQRNSSVRLKPINTSRILDFIQRRLHQSDAFILKSLP